MASILDRYGIKEVADITFYKIGENGLPTVPVLFLDTLKVSTVEQTAETADARGGKGNPKLITWDYGKEITVNIEDALFSPKSLSIMMGDGTVGTNASAKIQKTAVMRLDDAGKLDKEYFIADIYDAVEGSKRAKIYVGASETAPAGMVKFDDAKILLANGDAKSQLVSETGVVIDEEVTKADILALRSTGKSAYAGQKVYLTFWVAATTKEIVISGDSFPGTYYIQGDTYARSDVSGKDQFFQFIIPKAKMTAEQTITLEAEGDPSTFSMNLTVLRPEDGEMMKLVQYDLVGAQG